MAAALLLPKQHRSLFTKYPFPVPDRHNRMGDASHENPDNGGHLPEERGAGGGGPGVADGDGSDDRADLVLVQEAPLFDGNSHLTFDFLRAGSVLTARRKSSDWSVTTEDGLTREADWDVQVLALGRRGHRGRVLRVVNAYFQRMGADGIYRSAGKTLWTTF